MDYYKTKYKTIEYGMITDGLVLQHCSHCGESLLIGYDVYLDSYGNYYCNKDCYEQYMDDNEYDQEGDDVKEVYLCL